MGLSHLPEFLNGLPRYDENPDPVMWIGVGDPESPDSSQYASWTLSQAIAQVAPDGPVSRRLGELWVVFVYSALDREFRPRLAEAHGCDAHELTYNLLGDLRLVRHDIVHNGAIATDGCIGKFKRLRWFKEGTPVEVDGNHVAEFMALFPWDAMLAGPAPSK